MRFFWIKKSVSFEILHPIKRRYSDKSLDLFQVGFISI